MAEEFLQGGICGGTWWNLPSSKSACAGCSSPCMPGITDFGWASGLARDDCSSNCSSFSSFQSHHQKLQRPDSDSSLQIVGFGLSSSSTSDWKQSLPSRSNSMLQEEISSSTGELESSVTVFKPINQDFPFDQPPVTASSASYNYPPTTTTAAALIQTLFDDDPRPPPQPSVFNGRPVNYAADQSYGAPATSNDQLSSSWPKLPPFFRPASLLKQQQSAGSLQFTNNSPFWNAASNDGGTGSFSASSQSQFLQTVFAEKPTCPNQLNTKRNGEEVREGKKGSSETPTVKKARIETPSPLPTFKVRKEKLGDRITALQQLVSPFGKTDTASVLHEAIEYIKFLHDQVTVLSTPYMKQGGSPIQHQQMKGVIPADNNIAGKDPEAAAGANQDLRSRGLCLVPISNTFPLATETTADFWTPTFGATFR